MLSPRKVEPIDLVYTWFNSSDFSQVAARAAFAERANGQEDEYASGDARFADNGELSYSIPNACKYLPFVRNIFVVCGGLPPPWLKDNPRVTIIDVEAIVPPDVHPTYQSDVIESFLYKIPGLSERYLYSNDDMFFAKVHEAADFFSDDGKIILGLSKRYVGLGTIEAVFRSREINAARALNRKLTLKPSKSVGNDGIRIFARRFRGMAEAYKRSIPLLNTMTHVTQPFVKSKWNDFHKLFEPEVNELIAEKFRTAGGYPVNTMYHHYMRSIDLAELIFDPSHIYFDRRGTAQARQNFLDAISDPEGPVTRFCLNDAPGCADDGWKEYIDMLLTSLESSSTD